MRLTNAINAKTTLHPDGSKTESVRDPNTRELTEITYDANNVVTMKRKYLLNEQGQPSQGLIYDGADNLQARAQFFFDQFGRMQEERLLNLQGEVFQQTLYEYGADGKPKKPKVINYNVRTPTMKPSTIDFTQMQGGAPGTPAQGQPGQGQDMTPLYAPGMQPQGGNDEQQPQKKSFWKRLFNSKDKK